MKQINHTMNTLNSSFQANTADQIGPLYKWLVIVDDMSNLKNLAQILRVSDRVTMLSPLTVNSLKSDDQRFLLTKIDLLRPELVGEWKSQLGNWTFYSAQIFPEFRGLFGRNLLVGTLPVTKLAIPHVIQNPIPLTLMIFIAAFISGSICTP